MAKMTPEQEAAYALDFGVARGDLAEDAQLAYDRLVELRTHLAIQGLSGQSSAVAAGRLAGRTGAIAAAPLAVPPGQVRPRRRWYWLALAVGLLAFVWVAVALVLAAGQVNSFQRVPVPGSGQVSLQRGQYVIYYEPPGSFSGPIPPGHVNVTPLPRSGAVGGIIGYSGSLTYTFGTRAGVAVAIVQITQSGRFQVRATSSPAVPGAHLAIGPSISGWIWVASLPALGLALVGGAFAIVIAVMRRNHRRALLAQSDAH